MLLTILVGRTRGERQRGRKRITMPRIDDTVGKESYGKIQRKAEDRKQRTWDAGSIK